MFTPCWYLLRKMRHGFVVLDYSPAGGWALFVVCVASPHALGGSDPIDPHGPR
jgi:hypothetical protein